jgi:acyl dehydratase
VSVNGPYFEDLSAGQTFAEAPALTLGAGHAALHQALLGDRLRLALDAGLSAAVLRRPELMVHPGLVWDVAIGQSTLVTRRVVANLFYRGLVLRRAPVIGDTLATTTEVVALRRNRPRPGRRPTGLAALRIHTVDQGDRTVLDFHRCAMLPLGDPDAETTDVGDFDAIEGELSIDDLRGALDGGHPAASPPRGPGRPAADLTAGSRWSSHGGDVVSGAPELARLTLNVAAVHHDRAAAGGERLVYGGHAIGLAAAQASRMLPNLVTIVGWHSCDHLAPVHEGDTLHSELELERVDALPATGALAHLRSLVRAERGDDPVPVLDWRFVAVLA